MRQPRKAKSRHAACPACRFLFLVVAASLVVGCASSQSTPMSLSEAPPRPSEARARVLLVGSGRMGHIRARLLHGHPRLDFCGIVDADLAAARQLAAQCGNDVPVYESIAGAIQDLCPGQDDPVNDNDEKVEEHHHRRVHGCVISTPTHTHGELIREAARHRLSVFVEKPVAETASEIDELFEVCERAGVHLCCGFQRRFDDSYAEACRAIRPTANEGSTIMGAIGRPLYAHVFFADHPIPPRDFLLSSGGNIFVDLLAHDVDYVLNALQDQVETVYAIATSSDPDLEAVNVQDCATVLLTTRKGTVVTVFLSRGATYGYDQRCEVFGTRGHVRVDGVGEHATVLSDQSGVHRSRLVHSFPERFAIAFEREIAAFADLLLLQEGRRLSLPLNDDRSRDADPSDPTSAAEVAAWPVTRSQCVHVQRVVDATLESVRQGRVISLL